MQENRVFVDTNVLIYAHDSSAGIKHDKANRIVMDLWESGQGYLKAVFWDYPQFTDKDNLKNFIQENRNSSVYLWILKRFLNMAGEFLKRHGTIYNKKISPNPSFSKRGMKG